MWAPWIRYTLVHADEVIITATPELASLRNTKHLIDMLKQARPNDRPPKVVINQVGVPKRPEIPPAEFGKAIGIEVSCVIPHDPQNFGTAQSNGQMLFEVAPKSKAVEAIAGLAQLIAGDQKSIKPAKFSLSPIFDKLPLLRKK
jgi:pilus assembly protein CpaE